MPPTPERLDVRVDYLEQRQTEDRQAMQTISENGAATARTLAEVVGQVGALQRAHTKHEGRVEAEQAEQWKAIERSRELAVRIFLIVIAAAISYFLATGPTG